MLVRGQDSVDAAWLAAKALAAARLRTRVLGLEVDSDSYRVIHAEGDGLPGLMVDRLGSILSVEMFTQGWIPYIEGLVGVLAKELGTTGAVINADRRAREAERFAFSLRRLGKIPKRLIIREGALRFEVNLLDGHKTGFFCDQRDNRAKLAAHCAGRSVLDVCTYTGGFALAAKALGAAGEVTAVDIDEKAIAVAKRNANLNQVRLKYVHDDGFHYMRQMGLNGRKFDVVVLDPPKFVPSRKDMDEGRRKYIDMNTLALDLVEPGGLLLTCSCSGLVSVTDFVELLAVVQRRRPDLRVRLLELTGAGPDHPVALNCLESGYLKAAWLRVDRA